VSSDPSAEAFDVAAQWALEQPQMQSLMRDCYVTRDTAEDAQRFRTSAEFSETLALLAHFNQGPSSQKRLLDFGCGNGIASYAFSQAGYVVDATDLCRGNVAGLGAARTIVGLDGHSFRIIEGNVLSYSAENEYDVIYCRQVLHHLKPLDGEVMAWLARSLRRGGVLCAMREQVIWSEQQRERLKREHPLNMITQDEDGFYLEEYQAVLNLHGLRLRSTVWPFDSAINAPELTLAQLQAGLRRRLPGPLGAWLWNIPRLRHLLLRSVAYRERQAPPYQVFSFFAVKVA
jgi:SAM-dependent methyltransferase